MPATPQDAPKKGKKPRTKPEPSGTMARPYQRYSDAELAKWLRDGKVGPHLMSAQYEVHLEIAYRLEVPRVPPRKPR